MMQTLVGMWFALRKYGRFADVAQHLLRAERELLQAMVLVVRSLKDAAAPYAKEDPFASLAFEVFQFFERAMTVMLPTAQSQTSTEALRETQRRALLAIRDVLLDERGAVLPDAQQSKQRVDVIDAILAVIDRELAALEPEDEGPTSFIGPDPDATDEDSGDEAAAVREPARAGVDAQHSAH